VAEFLLVLGRRDGDDSVTRMMNHVERGGGGKAEGPR
jgi:hypothetical protein